LNSLTKLLFSILLLSQATTSWAEITRFNVTGIITELLDDQGRLDATGLEVGDAFTGYFIYDTSFTLTQQNPNFGDGQPEGEISITWHSGDADYTGFKIDGLITQKFNDNVNFDDSLHFNLYECEFEEAIAGTYLPNPDQQIAIFFKDSTQTVFSDVTTMPSSYELDPMIGNVYFGAKVGTESEQTGSYYITGLIQSVTKETVLEDGFESSE
jgi:hypothetical protein